jgi:hypothetical protein
VPLRIGEGIGVFILGVSRALLGEQRLPTPS